MNKYIKTVCAALVLTSAAASAQQTYSGYFLENYTYRFQMNPAFDNKDGFFSIPLLGNMNIAMRGNLHVKDVIYPLDDQTVLFTNPEIPNSAINKFHNVNRLGTNFKMDLLSFGFKAFGGYNTVSIGARVNANTNVPKALFQFLKEGVENKTYDIRNFGIHTDAYAQIALNHSRNISQVPGLRVGGALKFYIGAGNVDAYFDRATLTLGENSWNAVTNGSIYSSVNGMKFKTKERKRYMPDQNGNDVYYDAFDGMDFEFKGLNGFGIGFDLGAEYKWNDFNFSLALLDLGFISWGKTQYASTNGDQTFESDRFIFNANDESDHSFKNEWNNVKDNLEELYQLEVMPELKSRTRALAATLNIGVEYEFPLYRPLHFGFLSSTVIQGRYTWSQARFSANVAPVKWLSATANFEASTYGCGFGWLLNFYTKGFNFFVGMDHTMGKLAKQFVPLNSNASLNFGINIPL